MTTETMTLTDFLIARIAEDGEKARTPLGDVQYWQNTNRRRTLAECESKVNILHEADVLAGMPNPERDLGIFLLRLLALPYADHLDYNEEWRP